MTKVVQHLGGGGRTFGGGLSLIHDSRRAEPATLGRVQPKAATGSAVFKMKRLESRGASARAGSLFQYTTYTMPLGICSLRYILC